MIRKITFYAFILLTAVAAAQQTQNAEFKNAANQVFQNLDKSRVPNGILLDYGMDFTNLLAFDGVLRDTTLTTSQTITDIYKTLVMSRVTQNAAGFIPLEEYSTRWYTQREPGVMILSGLFFNYSKFDENAYPSKLNFANNQFSDKFTGGVWQNPYVQKQVFAVSPAVNNQNDLQLKVKLPSNLFLTNNSASIQSIQIDFSDNQGYQAVNYNQIINLNYSAEGYYTWRYKLTLTNGQILYSHSKIKIGNPMFGECINCQEPIGPYLKTASTQSYYDTAHAKVPITATVPYRNQLGKAVLHINYASPDHQIRKPLIVAEGFDLGVITNPEQEEGLNTRQQFINKYYFSGSSLPSALSSYDIIYVNWNNGVDFIQRNAYVLEEVIKYVNSMKAAAGSSTPNVIIGQSMGGLIARYALRDIELNRNFNHDTRMYISHDAPHLGANTPLSVQYAMRHIRNIYVSSPIAMITGESDIPVISNIANGIIDLINSNNGNNTDLNEIDYVTPLTLFSASDAPAARQMMVNWMNRKYEIKNGVHDLWQQELTAMGYPQGYPGRPIRNIAIANGSECGVLQPDNGNIMSYIKTAGSNTALSNYIGILDGVYGTFLTRPDIVSVGLLPGNSKWEIDFQSKYMTALNDSKNIYHGSVKYKKKVLWFIPVSITVSEKNAAQPANILPYDIYGGGRQQTDTESLVLEGIVSNSFGFIPTASALDIGQGSVSLNDGDFRKSYIGAIPPTAPKTTAFQNFVTDFNKNNPSASNTGHISFNARNGNWLASELTALENPVQTPIRTNCSFICSSGVQISGDNSLCNTSTYSVPNIASTYSWSVSQGSNLVSLSGNGTPSVSLLLLNPKSTGQIVLSLTLGSDDCGTTTISKTISVGNIAFNASIEGPYQICENDVVTYAIPGTCSSVPVIQWSVTPNLTIVSISGYTITVKENTGLAGSGQITAAFPSNGSTMTRYLQIGDSEYFTAQKTVFHYPTDLYNNYDNGSDYIFNMMVLPNNVDSEYTFSDFKVNGVPVNISTQKQTRSLHTFWVPKYLANDVECPVLNYTLTCTSRCGVVRSIPGAVAITCLGFLDPGPLEPIGPIEGRSAAANQVSYKIYPNPSRNTINISLADENYRPVSSSMISAELYNITGDLKTAAAIKNHTAQLDVSSLPLGVYVLRINVDGKTESHQVLIK
ncbi:T9SS type A sorting domain-containing protein [Flavobacterium plurextorum]|uniref:T9SS type A sorting domain-containing protein n=1 Tax=Flavobacterium TaxID=237 RepID=UPI00214D686F|nr:MULTISPECIES: T9SS type A sorting domain-containing protein [Flavobacterium]UUW08656.1 T9SS type A sorting domain-containing protein [Flavobacterium plurextorum]